MDNIKSNVYVKLDNLDRIIRCEGGYTTPADLTGWVQIDEGTGDRYNLCQSHYLPGGTYTPDGLPRWKLIEGAPVLRSEAELNKDRIEPIRIKKLEDISNTCNAIINSGTTVELSDGSSQFFSYSLEKGDQANIKEMFDAICMGAEGFVYHQDNGDCLFYPAADVVAIYKTLSILKTSNTSYHNQLKKYVNSLTDIEEIEAVKYGQELTGEYLEVYTERMREAEEQLNMVLSNLVSRKEQGGA